MLGTIVRALPVVLLLGGALPAQAQLTKRIGEAAKERITERKQRTKDHVVQRATEPVDSAVERVAAPIDSLAGQVGGGAAGAVSRLGREDAAAREAEELRLVEALSTVGRAELTGIAFAPGSDRLQDDGGPGFAALAVTCSPPIREPTSSKAGRRPPRAAAVHHWASGVRRS